MTGKPIPILSDAVDRLKKLDAYLPVELALRFTMALLLSRARIFTYFAPFGIGFAAAAPSGSAGIITLIGSVFGSLSFGDMFWALKYISVVLIVRVSIRIFKGSSIGDTDLFPPAAAFLATGCIGAVYAADTGWALRPTVIYVVETFLAGGSTYFYHVSLSPWSDISEGQYGRQCHAVSSVILISTLLMSLSSAVLFGVLSIGRYAAVVVMMLVIYRGGTGSGCAVATAIGSAMDLSAGAVPFFTMSYTFSAMTAGIFSKNGKLIFLLSYITANAITVAWTWHDSFMLPSLYEAFAASVTFMLLPDSLMGKVSSLFPSTASGYGFLKAREYTKDRVELASEAFKMLYDTVKHTCVQGTEDNVSVIFDRASDQVCRSCPRSSKCWQQDYSDTVDIMNNITPLLMKNGSISQGDLPSRFTDSCVRLSQLVMSINSEARAYLCRRQFKTRLSENRGAAYDQYNHISAVLHSLSLELGSQVTVEPSLERKLQRYLRGLDISASVAVFRVRGGRLRAEIRGNGILALKRDSEYLNKLSAVLGVRLCTPDTDRETDRLVLLEAEPLTVSIGSASLKKDGEQVSGDITSCFRTDEGLLYILLSDGMGSGQEAAWLSSATSSILERFLKAGVSPELTLRILSDLVLLKSDDDISSATVDLLMLDMFTGDMKLFKYGAAPSYIKKGDIVRRIGPGRLSPQPVSMKNAACKLRLSPESLVVMVSDGVLSSGDKWLKAAIAEFQGENLKDMAGAIVQKAGEICGKCDDMTALVLQVDTRV